jgi:DNA-binding response OmpR family regulator
MDFPIVLCIDDRPEQLVIRKAVLEARGFYVETVTSGYAAMKMLEKKPVDAVLLEYKGEGMDAEALAFQISQRCPDLPIILLSAYCEMPDRILWLVDEYIMKSELPDGLVPVIERVMRRTNAKKTHALMLCTSKQGAA